MREREDSLYTTGVEAGFVDGIGDHCSSHVSDDDCFVGRRFRRKRSKTVRVAAGHNDRGMRETCSCVVRNGDRSGVVVSEDPLLLDQCREKRFWQRGPSWFLWFCDALMRCGRSAVGRGVSAAVDTMWESMDLFEST